MQTAKLSCSGHAALLPGGASTSRRGSRLVAKTATLDPSTAQVQRKHGDS
jgi:hypothetical protein